jgi:hypothetical protein
MRFQPQSSEAAHWMRPGGKARLLERDCAKAGSAASGIRVKARLACHPRLQKDAV